MSNEIIVNDLNQYGIMPVDAGSFELSDFRIPIDEGNVARLSGIVHEIPGLATSVANLKGLGGQAYAITLDGKNVMPNELWQKKSGAYVSNLQGDNGHFGKQADVNPIDSSTMTAANVANIIFSAASVATSQYYLKSIDNKLAEVEKNTKDIINFLEEDKRSKIQSDFVMLKEIIEQMDSIKQNKERLSMKSHQVAEMQMSSNSNIIFYRDRLMKNLMEYKDSKKGGKEDDKIAEKIRIDYYYYKLSLQINSLTKIVEVMVSDEFNTETLSRISEQIKTYSLELKNNVNDILSVVFDYSADDLGTKAKLGFAKAIESVGTLAGKTPLKKFDIDDKLINAGKNTGESIMKKTKDRADRIVTKDDYAALEPYVNLACSMSAMCAGKVQLVGNGSEMFLQM